MFECVEPAYQRRNPNLPYAAAVPGYDAVRGDPRFQALMRRMGLAEAASR